MAEWGNPSGCESRHRFRTERTGGTETSQYPEEEKSIEMALVAASDRARAETMVLVAVGLKDPQELGMTSAEVPWTGAPETVRAR